MTTLSAKLKPIPATVANWGHLPDTALASRRSVAMLLECSERTIRRMEQKGELPRPQNYGAQLARFRVGDIRRFMDGR